MEESNLYTSEVVLIPNDVEEDGTSLQRVYTYNPCLDSDDLANPTDENEDVFEKETPLDEGPYGLHRVFTREKDHLPEVRVYTEVKMAGLVNTLRLRQNGWHFTDNIFECNFLNEKSINLDYDFTEVCF